MSHTLSQPEEVDHVFMEMAWNDSKEDAPMIERKQAEGVIQERWFGGYIPPYRAMHMKSMQSMLER